MQAFEGEEETVHRLYDAIKADDRHEGVITLSQEPIDGRNFPNWRMGFKHLGEVETEDLPEGFTQFMSADFDPNAFEARPGYARDALLGFKDASFE